MISLSTDSFFFIAFLALAPLLLRNTHKHRKYVFLALYLVVFIASMSQPQQLAVGLIWVLTPYFLAERVNSYRDGRLRPILIAVMVAVFAWLMKYDAIFETLHIPYVFTFRLLGLSYFLFRQIDYLMQYPFLREEEVRISLTDYLNYVLGFYTLLAGPILRYQEFVEDFYCEKPPLDREEIFSSLNGAVNGYIKVYVFSGICGYYAGEWFDGLTDHSGVITTGGAFCIFAFFNGWYL